MRSLSLGAAAGEHGESERADDVARPAAAEPWVGPGGEDRPPLDPQGGTGEKEDAVADPRMDGVVAVVIGGIRAVLDAGVPAEQIRQVAGADGDVEHDARARPAHGRKLEWDRRLRLRKATGHFDRAAA